MEPITHALEAIRSDCAGLEGTLASYIPELARADPSLFGLALASLDGEVYGAGDAGVEFTIQSVSKPFVYALALEDNGAEAVFARVGAEPSGEPFNAISLEPNTGRPVNPLVNAGAILVTSLVTGERFDRIHACLEAFAGRALGFDEAVYASESATGDRNRAIAHLMRAAGSLHDEVDAVVEAYFRQCSVLVTAGDLAVMAATLANGGVNPRSGIRVVGEETARHVLSVMAMCGMYDGAGEWMLRVGLPAKSGVAGGLLAVSPGQFGIGLFSPLLDAQGNTAGGVRACELLSERFGLHLLHDPAAEARSSKVALRTPAPRSRRRRPRAERAVLDREGASISLLRLHGDIDFAAAELALRSLDAVSGGWLVVDTSDVTRSHTIGDRLLEAIPQVLSARGTTVAAEPTLEASLEWCEHELLGRPPTNIPLADHDLLAEIAPEHREALIARCVPRSLAPGEPVLDGDDVLFAVGSGRVEVGSFAVGPGGIVSRLDPGSALAVEPTTGFALTAEALRELPPIGVWRSLAAWMAGA